MLQFSLRELLKVRGLERERMIEVDLIGLYIKRVINRERLGENGLRKEKERKRE